MIQALLTVCNIRKIKKSHIGKFNHPAQHSTLHQSNAELYVISALDWTA